jgi:hypothetical protein
MYSEEPIAGEQGVCSSVGYELEWQSSDDGGVRRRRAAVACDGGAGEQGTVLVLDMNWNG